MRGRLFGLILGASVVVALAGCASTPPASTPPAPGTSTPASTPPAVLDVSAELTALEDEYEARVGVSAIDTGSGAAVEFRSGERFGYASTVKVFVAAEFLRATDPAERDTIITWTPSDIDRAGYSPVTSQHLADGLTLAQLAEAAVRDSDNTATNLVMEHLGGPSAIDAGLELLGDTTSEVTDDEPDLNVIDPDRADNTTTPVAFARDLAALFAGRTLGAADLAMLSDWMSGNATGDALIRAGAPDGWTVADKSGGAGGIRNDIAIVTPPGRDPIVVSILTTKSDAAADYQDELVADVARVVLNAFA